MVEVNFFTKGNLLCGYEIKGHSGYGEYGNDTVCAAVSSTAIMAANTVTDIMNINADAVAEEGYLRFTVTQVDGLEESQAVLRGLELFLNELCKQYPKNVKVKYGGVQNA